jgi:vacuolar-type H+-ATPase catalytic subunit A/Vma1
MRKRNPAQNRRTTKKTTAVYSKYFLLTSLCGVVLVASFFFAARQHFSSIDYSIKNSRLRKQVEDLESDKRRLQLAREISLSPSEIKKAAKRIGFSELAASNTEVIKNTQAAVENARLAKNASKSPDNLKLVQKTVQTVAVAPDDRRGKAEKRDPIGRERKVQIADARR